MLARLGFPRRDDDQGAISTRPGTTPWPRGRRGRRRGRLGRRGRPAGLRRGRPPAAARAGGGGQGGLMASPGRDFYDILGVSRDASQDDIQRAYRRLARTYHPDVNKDPGAEDRFKDISEAYDVLSDPQTRRRYDAFGADFRQVPEDVDPETWRGPGPGRPGPGPGPGGRRWLRRGRVRVRRRRLQRSRRLGLRGPAGRAVRRPRPRAAAGWGPIPGADQEAELELTVEEAYRGGRRNITLTARGGRRRSLDVNDPARRDRRPADPAGRPGRPGQRRGAHRRPVPDRPDRPAPEVPARRPRPATSSCGSPRGRPRWARRSPWTPPAARPR